MKFLIPIDQKAALLAGIDAPHSTVCVDIPAASIPDDIRAEITPRYDLKTGEIGQGQYHQMIRWLVAPMIPPITPETVVAEWVARAQRWRQTYEEVLERKLKELRAAYAAAKIDVCAYRDDWKEYGVVVPRSIDIAMIENDPRWQTAIAELQRTPEYQSLVAEAQRLTEEEQHAASAKAKARDEAKRREAEETKRREAEEAAYIEQWVATHADSTTQEQYAEGLLSQDDVVDMLTDAALTAIGVPAAAPDAVLCANRSCPCCDYTVDTLPRHIYPAWRRIKANLPQGYLVEFRHRRDCEHRDDEGYVRHAASSPYWVAEITIPVGPFRAKRTVRLDP